MNTDIDKFGIWLDQNFLHLTHTDIGKIVREVDQLLIPLKSEAFTERQCKESAIEYRKEKEAELKALLGTNQLLMELINKREQKPDAELTPTEIKRLKAMQDEDYKTVNELSSKYDLTEWGKKTHEQKFKEREQKPDEIGRGEKICDCPNCGETIVNGISDELYLKMANSKLFEKGEQKPDELKPVGRYVDLKYVREASDKIINLKGDDPDAIRNIIIDLLLNKEATFDLQSHYKKTK